MSPTLCSLLPAADFCFGTSAFKCFSESSGVTVPVFQAAFVCSRCRGLLSLNDLYISEMT